MRPGRRPGLRRWLRLGRRARGGGRRAGSGKGGGKKSVKGGRSVPTDSLTQKDQASTHLVRFVWREAPERSRRAVMQRDDRSPFHQTVSSRKSGITSQCESQHETLTYLSRASFKSCDRIASETHRCACAVRPKKCSYLREKTAISSRNSLRPRPDRPGLTSARKKRPCGLRRAGVRGPNSRCCASR